MSKETHSQQMALLEIMRQKMLDVRQKHPQWFADYEDADPVTASREILDSLLKTAPTEYALGLLTGIMIFRQQLAILTDRSF